MKCTIRLFLFFLFFCIHINAKGQYSRDTSPIAILVQLRAESSRIKALTEAKRTDLLEVVKKEAKIISSAMIADFKDNFSFCPVYFYIDTNVDKILNKQFDGILMDTNGQYVKSILIDKSDSDYMIVFFGKPVTQFASEIVVKDPDRSSNASNTTGLVVCNDSLQQMYFILTPGLGLRHYKKHVDPKYWYQSQKFAMNYFTVAKRLNEGLVESYTKKQHRKKVLQSR